MNWGSLLLGVGIEDFKNGLSELVYRLGSFFPSILYDIWRLLAWVVNGIERIFRNLAGIGTKGQDMASKIIGDPRVEAIFDNLVAFSTVMIIVFTIVKIVQEHYKDKDGGNPYKIVIRTFKGILLFMFITSAALLGLEAAGMIFRGLDAATGGGSATVSGRIFKSMAYEANRKRWSPAGEEAEGFLGRTRLKYYYRVAEDGVFTIKNGDGEDKKSKKDGKYIAVQMGEENEDVTLETVREKFYENHPEYNYGIVNSDGSMTPMATWLKTQSIISDDYGNGEFSYAGDGWGEVGDAWRESVDGEVVKVPNGVGYNNEILKHVTLGVQPKISLSWAPFDIKTWNFALKAYDKITWHEIEVPIMPMQKIQLFSEVVKYDLESVVEKPMSETAKEFGFNLTMGVSLQDGTLAATFDFDNFMKSDHFEDILSSVLVNSIYTFLARLTILLFPPIIANFRFGAALNVDFLHMFSGAMLKTFEVGIQNAMKDVLPVKKDESGVPIYRDSAGNRVNSAGINEKDGSPAVGEFGPEYTVKPFAINSSLGNGVWVNANNTDFLPITIESYEFDPNFSELWSQLTTQWTDMVNQMGEAADLTYGEIEKSVNGINVTSQKIQSQQEWLTYKGYVDKYNSNAKKYLSRLGSLLFLYEKLKSKWSPEQFSTFGTDWLSDMGYEKTYADLEAEIQQNFVSLVKDYETWIGYNNTKKPEGTADALVTTSLYKPVITFSFTPEVAESLSIQQISDLLLKGAAENELGNKVVELGKAKGKVNLTNNLAGANNTENAYFRVIDWNAYQYKLLFEGQPFKNVAELIFSGDKIEGNEPQDGSKNLSQACFAYGSALPAGADSWESVGISYFLNDPESPFNENKSSDMVAVGNSYWGTQGVALQGHTYYQAFDGKWPNWLDGNNKDANANALSVEENTSKSYLSSAATNAKLKASKVELQSEILDNLKVSEEKSEAAKDFAKNIITFRPLGTETQENDKKVLNDWIKAGHEISIPGGHRAQMVYSMTADNIDDLMSLTGQRNYLILSKANEYDASDNSYGSYTGVLSYTDKDTVEALYAFGKMNYAVGLIAIISAMGVYLNFAIGLIQRAVNLAVIYIMSPIAISFYPFDNGSKFKSQFVEPFYKEAISAFAVIVSLNLFIVLIGEVEKMVNAVAPGLGWLGLVAFISMLPNIRDMLAGVMGAGKMQSKGIGSALDGAMSSLGEGFSGLKSKTVANAGKGIAKGLGTVGKLADRMGVFGADARAKRKARLEELQKEGKLGWWGEHQLNKMNKKEAKENRIKEALKSGDDSKLSKGEKKRLNKIKEAAAKEAAKSVDRNNYKTDAEYQDALAAKTSELAQDKKFQKSVNGVAKFGKNSEFGLWAQKNFGKGSLIGEAARMVFGHDGALAKNQNSVLGAFIRLGDPIARQKSRSQIAAEARLREEQMRKPEATMLSGMRPAAQNINDGQKIAEKAAREEYAEQKVEEQLKAAGSNRNNTALKALLAAKYRQEDPKLSAVDAENKASAEMNAMSNSGKDLAAVYAEMGGDKALVMGIAKGMKAFEGLSFTNNIDMDSEVARQSIRQIAAKNANESKNLETTNKLLKDEQAKRDNALDTIVNSTGKNLGIENDAAKMAKYRQILDKAGENDQFEDIVARVIDATGADENLVKASLSSQYNNFTSEVQFNSKVRRLQAEKAKHEAFAKAKTIVQGKVGDSIPEENLMEMIQDFANVDDADMNSLNVNSLGFKKQQIMAKFDSGELVDESGIKVTTEAARDAMIERLRVKMANEVGDKFKKFAADFTEDVRKFEGQKSFREEMMTTGTLPVMESFLDQYKFHLTTNVDPSSFQLITNDGFLKELREKGDYATRGQILEIATNAAERMDYDALAKTGLDAETQEKLIQMAKEGKTKALKGLHDLGVMENSSMGSIFSNMGGDSLVQAQTSFARVLGLVEANQAISKYNTQLGSLKSQESVARDQIRAVREEIPNLLSNPKFASIMGDIVDAQGNHVKTMEEMVKVVQANLDAANSGKSVNTSYIKATIDALNSLKKGNENNIDLINAINRMTGAGFAACTRANNYVLDIETVQALQSAETAYIQEATNKIGKGFSKVGS